MCPGLTSTKSSSSASLPNERKRPRAPSSASTARSGRARSPTKSESPVKSIQGSSPRLASSKTNERCSGRWPGVATALMRASPNLDHVAVFEGLVLVLDAGVLGDVDLRPGRLDQTALAGEVVGVVVRLEDVGDPEAVLFGYPEVLLYLPLRVYDRRLAAVGDDVGRAAQILVQRLLGKTCSITS